LNVNNEPGTVKEYLDLCGGVYLTNGIESLANIADCSVDYCFSNAVLEHIPRQDFDLMTFELFRIMKPNGVCVHRVDLKDHIGGGLNNLRFSESIWESKLFIRSGFYTNRIRFSEMLQYFSEAGFTYSLPRVSRWDKLPTPKNRISTSFNKFSDEDLLVNGFDLVLRKSVGSAF
jgi:SAM-dependent methyltransferase